MVVDWAYPVMSHTLRVGLQPRVWQLTSRGYSGPMDGTFKDSLLQPLMFIPKRQSQIRGVFGPDPAPVEN